jgi:uroporphyrinogen-III synthase
MSVRDERTPTAPQPLAGLSIVVTRADHQAEELAEPLRILGASVILLPMIGIAAPEDIGPLNLAIHSIEQYDWIFFTSVNAVRAVAPRVQTKPRARVGVVGEATRACAERLGWSVDAVPEEFTAEGLLSSLESFDLLGQRVLIPSGDLARDVLPLTLRNRGALVDVVEAYRNQIPPQSEVGARRLFLAAKPPDWVTFASPSAVENLVSIIRETALRPAKIASIGPTTSAAVRRNRLTVAAEPAEHTISGIVAAIVDAVIP